MLSATADHPDVSYAPPATVTQDPVAAQDWVNSLPEGTRQRLEARLAAIFRSLPPILQLEVQRKIVADGGTPAFPTPVDGLGGIGDIGGALVALAQVGASIFNAHQASSLQQSIAEGAQSTSAQIAAAQAQANKEAQLAMIAAQTEAVKLKAVSTAQTKSAILSYMPAILGGVGVLALVFVIIKARSKRTP